MIKKLSFSRKGMRKKIASLSLLALLFNATMIGSFIPSKNVLNAITETEISVREATLSGHTCDQSEWHFIINQINTSENKPANINVEWSNGTSTTLELDLNDPSVNAHYRTTDNLNLNVINATATIYNEWNGKFNLSHGPCNTPETESGSITICKIIIDEDGNIADGSENDGEFTISGIEINGHNEVPDSTSVLGNTVFETTLIYNADLIGEDQIDDAECVLYDNLELGSYYYSEEVILGNNWETPLYNDLFTGQLTIPNSFSPYSGELFNDDDSDDGTRNMNTDGHIVLSSSRLDRTLVVLNKYETPTEPEKITIVASKIVCDNEEDLPNWGGGLSSEKVPGEPNIIELDTAQEYVDNSLEKCHLVDDWSFQVGENKGDDRPIKYPGDFVGEAPSEDGWITFTGTTQTTVALTEDTEQLRLREVLPDGYIPFTHTTGNNDNDISAEFYCYNDIHNYDNYDWITNPIAGTTYYCVAFNTLTEPDCTDEDGDGYATEGEDCGPVDCDDTDTSINPEATEICGNNVDENCDEIAEDCYCDPIMARVVIENYNATDNATINNQIYVGSKTNIYASGEWFPVYENGAFINDPDVESYEEVEGLAIQRKEGTVRAVLDKGANNDFRHLDGYIEFYNASIDGLRNDLDSDNELEKDEEVGGYNNSNGTKGDAGDDEVWMEINDNNHSYFYLGVTIGDDGYYTDYSSLSIGECKNSFCGDGIVNQSWEECDGTNGLFGSGYNTCTEQCQFEGDENCSDLVLARVNVTEAWNDQGGNGDMTSDIYLGSATNSVPAGTWFELYHNGSYTNDANIYENVPGLAIQRSNGSVRAVIYGSAGSIDIEHINGNIEFYNANVTHLRDEIGDNKLENDIETGGYNDSDGNKEYTPVEDEVWIADERSYFWMTVNTLDDGYYTDWEIIEDCIACESELRIDVTYFANFGQDDPDMSDYIYVGNSSSVFGQDIVTIPLTTDDRTNAIIDDLIIDNDNISGLHIQRGEDTNGSYFEISAYGFNHNLTRESIKANTQLINATISSIENDPADAYENPLDGICGIIEGDVENDLPGNDEYSFTDGANAGKICSITNIHRDRIRVYYEPTQECGIYCGNGQIDSGEQCDDGNNTDGDGCSAICTTETPIYGPYCGDGINGSDVIDGIQDWEECDAGHLIENGLPITGCSTQCQIMGASGECSEDVFARVVITDVQNEGNGADMTTDIFLGTDILPIPQGAWFPLYYNGVYMNDLDDIDTYQDVPGLATERQDGQVRVQIYGSHPNNEIGEYIKGHIEFYNNEEPVLIYPLINDLSNGNMMEGSDWNTTIPTSSTPTTAERDYAWTDGNKSHFWMAVTTADDGYFTPYEVPVCDEDPICSIFGHKYNKTGIGLVDWIIGLAQIVECTIADEEWADHVVSYLPGAGIIPENQVPAGEFRGDKNKALGIAEDDDTYNFVSLGRDGGTLILEFNNLILNKTGNDIQIIETSFNNPTYDNYREKAKVYASQDGIDWSYLGIAYLDEEFDLDNGTLASDELTPFILKWAQYIKLVDESIDGTDGYDVDAVKALHCGNGTITTTTTNDDGEYCFADVDAGNYKLYEEMQSGWNILKVMSGLNPLTYFMDSFFDVFVEITVTDEETTTVVDFYNEEEDVTENQPPVADAGLDQTVIVNTVVTFDGSGSTDSDGTIISYDWNFNDGNTGTGIAPTHTYGATGTYTVVLTVTDDDGATDTDTVQIIVEDENGPVDPGDIIINEIMWTGNSGEPNDQWIELKNVSSDPINLEGCQLKYHKDTGNENKIAYLSDSTDVILNSDTFYLVSHYTESTSHIDSIDPGLSGTSAVNNFEYNEFQIKLYCPDTTGTLVEIDVIGDAINPPTFGDNSDPKRSMKKCGSEWQTALDEESGTTYNWDDTAEEKGTPGLPNVCENGPVCGNGTLEGNEKCDDNNNDSFDGCSSNCQIESIFGYKFNDESKNGADDNEPKLSNWTIKLYNDASMTTSIDTAITSSETATIGYYSFENLGEGDYWIEEIQQPGWIQTTPITSTEVNLQTATSTQQVKFGNRKTQCFDGIDNDGDTFIDANDPGCWTDENDSNTYDPNDDNEENGSAPVYECSDGNDNDGDGLIDTNDPGCHTDWDANNDSSYVPTDNDEYHPYCGDGACNNNESCSTCSVDCGNCGGGGGGGIIYPKSIIITNEKVIYLGEGEAMVSWTTNIETTRQVAYGDDSISVLGTLPEYGYDSVNTESTDMTKEHSMIIAGLTDEISYYFRPIADRNGSTGEVVGIEVSYKIGEVKGIEAPIPTECNYLLEYIKLGALNDPVEVKKLEWFLNEFEGESLAINGIYEQVDFDAVSRFQEKYLEDVLTPWGHIEATGYVYITTKKKINELYCQREFPLTKEQEAEVARFSTMFSSLAQGDEIPFEYDIFTPESYTEEGTSEYYEDEIGEVIGTEDEDESGEEGTEDESRSKEGIEELGYDETLLIDEDDNVLLIGEDEDNETSEDNSIVKAFKDFTLWIWLIVIAIIGIIAYFLLFTSKQKKEEGKDGNENEEKETEK